MCGIAGVMSWHAAVDPDRIVRMRDVLEPRGPDDSGLWTDGPVGLGHRRLSIIDVAGGHQPMSNSDGTVWVVFNGEIYNHADVRRELVGRGYRYRTQSDTETILHAYDEYGERGIERLQGMFAFALWDRFRRRLLLARDRLGIKPLYYAVIDDELLFASEIKSLVAGGLSPQFNRAVLPEFLANRYVAGEETFFNGVRKVPPGHVFTWSAESRVPTRRRYWQLPAPSTVPARALATEAADLRERLRGAVARHLMSDVPLGVFLSGGLDSSALAALAAGLVDEPLRTFSVGFDDAASNELPYARLVAKAIGAEHHEVVVSEDAFFGHLPHLVWQQDEPMAFTSNVPLYFVSELARQHVKVVLTGEGADELFLGYNRYRVTHWNARLAQSYTAFTTPRQRARVRGLVKQLPGSVRRYAGRSFLGIDPARRSLMFDNFAVFPEVIQRRVLADEPAGRRDPFEYAEARYDEASGSDLARMSATDLQTYLCELLMKQDRMSMAASVESRVPFLDDQLVEWACAMPVSLKLRGWTTKAVLRAAVRDVLPDRILSRKKMGFPVPFGQWLRGAHWPVVREFVLGDRARARGWFQAPNVEQIANEHRSGAANHGERLWLLINLEIWHRIFCEGERPADVMEPVRRQSGRSYARGLDQDERTLAADDRRPPAYVPDAVGALRAAPGPAGHHGRA